MSCADANEDEDEDETVKHSNKHSTVVWQPQTYLAI